ncbi:MAG: hypothetical protein QM655_12685 [Nocardioidaceae bacterium]
MTRRRYYARSDRTAREAIGRVDPEKNESRLSPTALRMQARAHAIEGDRLARSERLRRRGEVDLDGGPADA